MNSILQTWITSQVLDYAFIWLLSQRGFSKHPEPLSWAKLSLGHIFVIPYLLSIQPMWFISLRSVQCHLNKELIQFGYNNKDTTFRKHLWEIYSALHCPCHPPPSQPDLRCIYLKNVLWIILYFNSNNNTNFLLHLTWKADPKALR